MKKHLNIYLALFIVLIGCSKDELEPDKPIVIPIANIELSETSKTLKVNGEFTIGVKINPENTTEAKTITWETSNASVAAVSNGLVRAISLGDATITTKVGGKTAICKVTVSATNATGITLSETEKNIHIGDGFKLIATIEPADATNKSVLWTSSDESIATVEDGNVIGLSVGEAVITATSEDGEFSATCVVGVLPISVESVKFEDMTISLVVDKTTYISPTVLPENATNKKVSYRSFNENVFTIDQSGKVFGVSEGTAIAVAETEDGNMSAFCEITVLPFTADISIRFRFGSASFPPGGYMICNSVEVIISNNSKRGVRVTDFFVLDSSNYIAYGAGVYKNLYAGGEVSVKNVSFALTHRPRAVFKIEADGKEYIIDKVFFN